MAFDGIITAAVTKELQDKILLGKIEKIYQPESDELVFHIHSKSGNYKLYASTGSSHSRIHFVKQNFSNPQTPMSFCMLLRKHLQGGRITQIEQKLSERIIEIYLETLNEMGFSVTKKIVFEIMGKHSNIIIVDVSSNKIIDSIKRISVDVNRVRQILPGKEYEYPPIQDKIFFKEINKQHISVILQNEDNNSILPDNLGKILLNNIGGISPSISNMLAYICENLSKDDYVNAIADKMQEINDKLSNGSFSPIVYLNQENTPQEFHIVPLVFEDVMKKIEFSSISEAIEYYFSNKNASNRVKQKSTDLDRAVKNCLDKMYLKKQRLSEDLLEAQNSEDYRLFGEILTANLHKVPTGAKNVELINYYDGSTITIPLDIRFSPSKNAQIYFKKYGKSKTAIKEKQIQLEETNSDIYYLETIISFIENATTVEETEELRNELVEGGYLRKRKNNFLIKKTTLQPHEFISSDGFRILVGRNNKQNDVLTFKMAKSKDTWFHTKDIPGSHVILFNNGNQITETAIFEAAGLAAYYSKGKDSENVPVDYAQVRHVKKPTGAKPGMVIFTNNKTVYITPKLI